MELKSRLGLLVGFCLGFFFKFPLHAKAAEEHESLG